MIWYLGDSALEDAVTAYAAEQEDSLLVSAKPEAIPADIWTSQVHDSRGQRWKLPFTAVVYLPDTDYDSELTHWHLRARIPKEAKIIFIVPPDAVAVREGLTHGEDQNLSVVQLDGDVVSALRAA